MTYRLGINTGFAVNRYSEPEEWTRIVGEDLGLKFVQLTADVLNPDLPPNVLINHASRIVRNLEKPIKNVEKSKNNLEKPRNFYYYNLII